jgi:hypothetical protein
MYYGKKFNICLLSTSAPSLNGLHTRNINDLCTPTWLYMPRFPTAAAAAARPKDTIRSPSSLLIGVLTFSSVDRGAGTRSPSPSQFLLGLWILIDQGFSFFCHCWGGGDKRYFEIMSLRSPFTSTMLDLSDLLFFFRSWHLVCLPEEAVGWLSMRRSRPLLLVCSTARSSIFNMLLWWWRIVSLRRLEFFSSRCLSVCTRSCCQRQVTFSVFKALFDEGVCRRPFSLLSS